MPVEIIEPMPQTAESKVDRLLREATPLRAAKERRGEWVCYQRSKELE